VESIVNQNVTLWNADDVSAFLKVSRSWVYQKAAAGFLPCISICGCLRFDPEEILAFARGASRNNSHVVPLQPSLRQRPRRNA